MAATDFGTLFLDASLRIKRFTRSRRPSCSASRPPTRAARSPTSRTGSTTTDLTQDARAVLSDLAPVRREVAQPQRPLVRRAHAALPHRRRQDRRRRHHVRRHHRAARVEEALRSSEQQLRQQKRLVELSREPIFVWDFDAGIVDWNRGCEELYGYSRQEAVGKRTEQLLRTMVPDSTLQQLNGQAGRKPGHWYGAAAPAREGRADADRRSAARPGDRRRSAAGPRKHARRHATRRRCRRASNCCSAS